MLLFHVLFALWLTGGVFGSIVARAQARRATGAAERLSALRIAQRLNKIYTLPGLVLSGLTGIALVGHLGYAFSQLWVHLSTVLWALMLAAALFVLTPGLKRSVATAEEAAATEGDDGAAAGPSRLVAVLGDVLALLIVVLVALMVLKPA
jgi:uncharacterized membrane protein